jgi:putative transposase
MPRMIRLQMPGSLVHIMARGIDGRKLFNDDDDRTDFLNRMKKCLNKNGYLCIAWCLMDNHYHLLVRMNENLLEKVMRPLNGGYALHYNHKYKRNGYLFQDRFKSVLCQEFHYTSELIRYIHLNPLRADKVKSYEELFNWKWSSHCAVLGGKNSLDADFINRIAILNRFGNNEFEALVNYRDFLNKGIGKSDLKISGWLPKNERTELAGAQKGWPAVIGDPDFVKKALEVHPIGSWRLHRKCDYTYIIDKIALEACSKFNISPDDLIKRGRCNQRSFARAYFCNILYTNEKIPLSVIANYLTIFISPVAKLVEKGMLMSQNEAHARAATAQISNR